MSNIATHAERITTQGAEQLTLLAVPESTASELKSSSAHARFRLSKTTRQRGLAHVAEIRRQLAASQTEREAERINRLPARRPAAA